MDNTNVKTDLSKYDNSWYKPGGSGIKRGLWYITNSLFFNSCFPVNGIKLFLLRLFGAKVGKGVVIKPSVNIKYPWKLDIGDYVWIGEKAWIDNLAKVTIGDHVCISQGALLLTGNHHYKKLTFDLVIGEIVLKNGVWIGAKAIVCPGITCEEHAILSVGSIATEHLKAYTIYQGNPAVPVRDRNISV
jgi:putative colanic acid biosynthesis acetyltransferase WcaF